VVERGVVVRILSEAFNYMHGIAWSADAEEILVSHGSVRDGGHVTAYSPADGRSRSLLRTMTPSRLHDVAANGAILLTADSVPISIEGRLAEGTVRLGIGAGTGATIDGISEDGSTVVGTIGGVIDQGEYQSFYRRGGDGDDIGLGSGGGAGITPDGRWALLSTLHRDRSKLRMVPTGPGEARVVDLGDVELEPSSWDSVTATATGRRIAFRGRRGVEEPRGFVLDLDGSAPPRVVTPEGAHELRISPDGRLLVAADRDGALALYPTDGGPERAIAGAAAGEAAVAWASGSDALYLWDRTLPVRLARLDLATGKRELALEWRASGSGEALYGLLTVTTDARYFVMRFRSGVSSLVVARGAR
jgi:hypothetical protein